MLLSPLFMIRLFAFTPASMTSFPGRRAFQIARHFLQQIYREVQCVCKVPNREVIARGSPAMLQLPDVVEIFTDCFSAFDVTIHVVTKAHFKTANQASKSTHNTRHKFQLVPAILFGELPLLKKHGIQMGASIRQ